MENCDTRSWDLLSDYWDERMGDEGDWYYRNVVHPAIFKLIDKIKGLKILDAGCGTGSLSRSLAKRGASVVGVDYSSGMIRHAIYREKKEPLNIMYYCVDISQISGHLQENFDIVIADFIMQDAKYHKRLLKELKKRISSNGRLIISLEHPCFSIFDELHVTTRREWGDHKYYGKDHLKILARYEKSKRTKIIWEESLSTKSYHRTLEEYFSALHDSGFLVSRLLEPTPPASLSFEGPKNNVSHKVPMFIIMEALPINHGHTN